MVQTVTKGGVTSDWLAFELDGNHRQSRENVTVAASQTLVDGQVIAYDGTGKAVAFTAAVSQVPAGIYVGDAVTTGASATAKGVAVVRDARVVVSKLTWHADVDSTEQTAALAELLKLGITTVRSA